MSDPTAPEPTTFAELMADGWVSSNYIGAEWLDIQIGPCEVTVFRDRHVTVATVSGDRLSEADACRLAHGFAEVLRNFKPIP